jgi:hypothetical protein
VCLLAAHPQTVSADLFLVTIAKALVEIAALFIIGQGILYVLSGEKREGNFFYQLLRVTTRPVYSIVRLLTPKVIVDRHVPWVALMVLFWLWLALTFAKIQICAERDDRCLPDGTRQTSVAPFRASILRAGDAPVTPL